MTTYYHRSNKTGEITNASDTSLTKAQLEERFPLTDGYYDSNPPLDVLQRYRYWNERP